MSDLTLEKTLELIQSRYTAQLEDRHVAMVRRICSTESPYESGFYYKDLPQLMELIQLLHEGFQAGRSSYADALVRLVRHCGFEFKKVRMSDTINFTPLIPEFIRTLVPLLRPDSGNSPSELIEAVCDFLRDFVSKDANEAREKERKR